MSMQPVKTTILGGLVFLVPLVIVIAIVGKAFELMRRLAAPLGAWIPVDSVGGIATANIVTVLILLLLCYFAGLIAGGEPARRLQHFIDDKLLTVFPRYALVKSVTESISGDESNKTLQVVLVQLDDQSQIGFEVERKEGLVTVFLPGSPDPWSGTVVYVTEDRIRLLDVSFNQVVKSLQRVGLGGADLLK